MHPNASYQSDSDDEREEGPTVLVGAPAYSLTGRQVGTGGPQCSQTDEYCYFCAFKRCDEEEMEDTGGDTPDAVALWDLVESMANQGKELHVIVEDVWSIYRKDIQKSIVYEHPTTNIRIDKPAWSKESVRRHLLFSATWPELFDASVTSMFQSMIYNQNNHVMDPRSDMVIEERRTALLDTIKQFTQWRTAQSKLSRTATASKSISPKRLVKNNKCLR